MRRQGSFRKILAATVGVGFWALTGPLAMGQELVKTQTGGPAEVGIALPMPTAFEFVITYSSPADVPVRIFDTVPAEFEVLGIAPSAGTAEFFKTHSKNMGQGKGKEQGATRIVWDLDAGVGGTLTVSIQTVESPGVGHAKKGEIVFKPTSCGPLSLNDGAVAVEVDPETGEIVLVEVVDPVTLEVTLEPVVVAGPSNSLEVTAVEGAKACEEEETEEVAAQ